LIITKEYSTGELQANDASHIVFTTRHNTFEDQDELTDQGGNELVPRFNPILVIFANKVHNQWRPNISPGFDTIQP